ncbi:unnamed protein product, partial [Ranitomeya imitator]
MDIEHQQQLLKSKRIESCGGGPKGIICTDQKSSRSYLLGQYDHSSLSTTPGGTKYASLKEVAARIFFWAEKNLLSVTAVHLRGLDNTQADFLSRKDVHPGEWSLDQAVFQSLTEKWGTPEVDLFANRQNAKRQGTGNRCLFTPVEIQPCICLSSHSHAGENSAKNQDRRSDHNLDCPIVAREELVRRPIRYGPGRSLPSTSKDRSPTPGSPTTSGPEQIELGGMATEATILKAKGLSDDVIQTLQNSRKAVTNAIYTKGGEDNLRSGCRGRFLETELTIPTEGFKAIKELLKTRTKKTHMKQTRMLHSGWSVHTYQTDKKRKNQSLDQNEIESIIQVIRRAEKVDTLEQQRIGRLVERLENMRKNVMGNGMSQCLLCGEHLGLLGTTSVFCQDCKK